MQPTWLDHYILLTFNRIDSTNSEALRIAQSVPLENFVILAHEQTKGRGRKGKIWKSVPGNLQVSILLSNIHIPIEKQVHLSFITANALYEAIESLISPSELEIKLKWPNDVLINGKKVAGILLESITISRRKYVSIGVGVNITNKPIGLKKSVTSLKDEAIEAKPEEFLNIFMNKFDTFFF